MRLRLIDCRLSRLPSVIGKCQSDVPEIANAVNTAQRRLLYAKEASDESWWGTWAEVRLNVSRAAPYITLPREIARLEEVTVCDRPIPVHNQFFEYLQFGNGRMFNHHFRNRRFSSRRVTAAYTRNDAVLFTDLVTPQFLALYPTDAADTQGTTRVLVQGLDVNGQAVYSQDGQNRVNGIYLTLKFPFVVTPMVFSKITGLQKDVTNGPVNIFQMDPSTGDQVQISMMQPGELVAGYRRYFFDHLPCSCCPPISHNPCLTSNPALPPPQVTSIVKLDLIPVAVDTDYLLFHNLEAIIEECRAARYSEMDTLASKQLEEQAHTKAIRLLNGELGHFNGVNKPAVWFAPFGSARLEKQCIGTQI